MVAVVDKRKVGIVVATRKESNKRYIDTLKKNTTERKHHTLRRA
jgi:hypothetical protein